MRQNAQFIRQGYGSSAWVRENSVSQGLGNLRDQLQQAQAANQQSGKPGQGPGGDNSDLEKALARVEAMRSRMQQLAENQGKGKQPGQGEGQGRQSNPLQRGNQSGNGQQPGQGQQRPERTAAGPARSKAVSKDKAANPRRTATAARLVRIPATRLSAAVVR